MQHIPPKTIVVNITLRLVIEKSHADYLRRTGLRNILKSTKLNSFELKSFRKCSYWQCVLNKMEVIACNADSWHPRSMNLIQLVFYAEQIL